MTTQPILRGRQQLAGSLHRRDGGTSPQFLNSPESPTIGVLYIAGFIFLATVTGVGFAASLAYFLFV